MLEIDDIEQFQAWLLEPERPAAAIEALDLTGQPALERENFEGCLFLDCELDGAAAGHLAKCGALVLDMSQRFPFPLHRSRLYTPAELFEGYDGGTDNYQNTYDYRVYEHYVANGKPHPRSIVESLARRLHDHAMTNALHETIAGRRVVAIMGGHGLERGEPEYRTVARISRALTRRGYLLVSGGGPGAMEATHVGSWFAHFDDDALEEAIGVLSVRPPGGEPGREYADPDWLQRAWRVLQRWPVEAIRYDSVGIPTWLYGHEPPSPFATHLAKYFANSVREEGLLAIATSGVIFAKGSAGTTQEIFQDAAQNHYRTFGKAAPMILLGRRFWAEERPVWPLLERVAHGRYDHLLTLTDDEEVVVERITAFDP